MSGINGDKAQIQPAAQAKDQSPPEQSKDVEGARRRNIWWRRRCRQSPKEKLA